MSIQIQSCKVCIYTYCIILPDNYWVVMIYSKPGSVKAVLGPTNTGKTHYAIDRMLGHATGMIGFPLRLLARENYDRVVSLKGKGSVALITGEERIIPDNPRFYLCTVEAMPMDKKVAFLAIDEIQLCSDPERGHIFTERLLGARGVEETLLLGARTMASILRKLVPEITFLHRERFSRLQYSGHKKITRLPPRTAVVAFSAANVYGIAELLRRQRGGAAVVLGALSPRTRNAQVALYEAGEVDYLVASDAIGMGLNMGIDHVAFSSVRKYDGNNFRYLLPSEIAQIAGRAGRFMSDGTFGPTADLGPFDNQLIESLENHSFESLYSLFWRSNKLDFSSPISLKRSLETSPPSNELRRVRISDDYGALIACISAPDIMDMATNPEAVRLLWEVCRIPDFAGDLSGSHPRLVRRIYQFLMTAKCRIPREYISRAFNRLNRIDGDIDTLTSRIAAVRTWTYVSYRSDWIDDSVGWQQQTNELENKLSDALHDCLTQRFVDRDTAVLVRRLRDREPLLAGLAADGKVTVEGNEVGWLEGFNFVPNDGSIVANSHLLGAVNRVIREAIGTRVSKIVASQDNNFSLDFKTGEIDWNSQPVARLTRGASILCPNLEILPNDLIEGPEREQLRRRLIAWLRNYLSEQMLPLVKLNELKFIGEIRGIVYRLTEGLGSCNQSEVFIQKSKLSVEERKILANSGVRIGIVTIYMPKLLKGKLMPLKGLLYTVFTSAEPPTEIPNGGATSLTHKAGVSSDWYRVLGFYPSLPLAVRVDLLERLLADVRRLSRNGPFSVTSNMLISIGASPNDFANLLRVFGYSVNELEEKLTVNRNLSKKRYLQRKNKVRKLQHENSDSPFAILKGFGSYSRSK